MSAKNTYMKFDYMRLSHMRVKWDEIRYIPICRRLGGFGTNKNFAKCDNCGSRTCFRVRRFSTDLCQFYTSGKNHTSSSQTL